eukprot:4670448-Amphidinium_carterae.1
MNKQTRKKRRNSELEMVRGVTYMGGVTYNFRTSSGSKKLVGAGEAVGVGRWMGVSAHGGNVGSSAKGEANGVGY